MTVKEAIENREKCMAYLNQLGAMANPENVEAVKMSLDALKKQLPAEPVPEEKFFGNGKCPRCGAVFMDKSTNYCGNCGQALKWEENNG